MQRSSVQDDLRLYLQQIGRTPLLTAQQERELGWRIINECDEQAKDLLVISNLRLVVSICSDFVGAGAQLLDLIAEGNIGLIRAAERFDPAHGVRFSTYATCWIRRMVHRSIASATQTIHIPGHMRALIDSWNRAVQQHRTQLGRLPTPDELAVEMKVSLAKLRTVRRAIAASRIAADGGPPDDRGAEIADIVQAPEEDRPESDVARREEYDRVMTCLRSIDGCHAHVLRLRLGLEGKPPQSFRQIGHEIGMTGEGARKAESAGLRRLRSMIDGRLPVRMQR